jgi:hypothetical protein
MAAEANCVLQWRISERVSFSVKRYLKSRDNCSALSAGPSFVKNDKEAIEISKDAAKHLSGKLIAKHWVHSIKPRSHIQDDKEDRKDL